MDDCPSAIDGMLEISCQTDGVLISGDPAGLGQLARLISWLARADQTQCETIPDGERIHVHMYPGRQLTRFSVDVEISRLDAKGTGDLPAKYSGLVPQGGGSQHGLKRTPRRKGNGP